MANTRSSQLTGFDWLTNWPLAPHVDVFKQYLTDRGYAATIRQFQASDSLMRFLRTL
jgi:hypothetical protein